MVTGVRVPYSVASGKPQEAPAVCVQPIDRRSFTFIRVSQPTERSLDARARRSRSGIIIILKALLALRCSVELRNFKTTLQLLHRL